MSNWVKKPKCEGGCEAPYEQITSKKDGKVYNKCMTCENLVFNNDKKRDTTPAELCIHNGERSERFSKKPESAGRRYSVCAHCQKDFKWEDGDENKPATTATSSSTATMYSLPLTTLVQDLGAKVDSLVKNGLQYQAWISELQLAQKRTDEQLDDIIGRLPAETSVSHPGGGRDDVAVANNKRRKT